MEAKSERPLTAGSCGERRHLIGWPSRGDSELITSVTLRRCHFLPSFTQGALQRIHECPPPLYILNLFCCDVFLIQKLVYIKWFFFLWNYIVINYRGLKFINISTLKKSLQLKFLFLFFKVLLFLIFFFFWEGGDKNNFASWS